MSGAEETPTTDGRRIVSAFERRLRENARALGVDSLPASELYGRTARLIVLRELLLELRNDDLLPRAHADATGLGDPCDACGCTDWGGSWPGGCDRCDPDTRTRRT